MTYGTKPSSPNRSAPPSPEHRRVRHPGEKGVRFKGYRVSGFIDVFNIFNANPPYTIIQTSGASFMPANRYYVAARRPRRRQGRVVRESEKSLWSRLMSVVAAVVVVLAFADTASAQIMEMNGTWKLRTLSARSARRRKRRRSSTRSSRASRPNTNGIFIEAHGRKGHNEWAAPDHGRHHPAAGGRGGNNTVSLQKLDKFTELVTNKRDGKVTSTYTRVLVDDGKTIMLIGRDGNNKVIWVRVFEKQP